MPEMMKPSEASPASIGTLFWQSLYIKKNRKLINPHFSSILRVRRV